jgi:alkaline phosphatase D
MSIGNLKEQFLYDLLPDAVVSQDDRGYIEAVVSGVQDRLEDVRSYAKKLDLFWQPGALPTGSYNVILVDLVSEQGKAYTRSLDIQTDTPAPGSSQLPLWAAFQLNIPVEALGAVRYGYDALRAVDVNTLAWLAQTLGAILYDTDMLEGNAVNAAQVQLVSTWFPRLKIKGTNQSFEVLGKILGFDDIRMTPLWSRLNPHVPDDVGNSANATDYAAEPEYAPQQVIGPYYDPFVYRDGPFYSWSTTVNNGTNSTEFYTESVNGKNPWIRVALLGSLAGTNVPSIQNGTVTHPATGSYALANGNSLARAYVDPLGSSVRFQAVADGASFNGIYVHVTTVGTLATIAIEDRLSAIKYRSSYFDLGLTADMDKVEEIFGSRAATTNKDLKANPNLTPDGTAESPYRPWVSGSIAVAETTTDWVTSNGDITYTVVARQQADPAVGDRQLNTDSLVVAGVQVTQALEEVRAATRLPRRSQTGFLVNDSACYAPYAVNGTLFTEPTAVAASSGTCADAPLGSYVAALTAVIPNVTEIKWVAEANVQYVLTAYFISPPAPNVVLGTVTAQNAGTYAFYTDTSPSAAFSIEPSPVYAFPVQSNTATLPLTAEVNPANYDEYIYAIKSDTNITCTGSFNFATGQYGFSHSNIADFTVLTAWTLVSTGTIRPEPYESVLVCETGTFYTDSTLGPTNTNPTAPWPDTGIFFQQGELISITTVGSVSPTPGYWIGPEGYNWAPDRLDNRFKHEALLGRVGLSGSIFLVGSLYSGAATDTGSLYLVTNDVSRANNEGSFTSYITVCSEEEQRAAEACLCRPEDEDDGLIYEVADDFPWNREVTVGGELVELDIYRTGTDIAVQELEEATAFNDQTGVDINVYALTSPNTSVPRLTYEPRSIAKGVYSPAYTAIGYQGTLKDLSTLTSAETDFIRPPIGSSFGDTETDYDVLFQPGYSLYHVGLAQGVLVADLVKFFGPQHSVGLVGWFAFNEHVDAALSVVDHSFRATPTDLIGVNSADRHFDSVRGWCLTLNDSQVIADEYRDLVDEVTAAFWIKRTATALYPSTETTIVDCSLVYFTLSPGGAVTGYAKKDNGVGTALGSVVIADGEWHFIYIRRSEHNAVFGDATLSTSAVEINVAGSYLAGDPDIDTLVNVQAANGAAFTIHDLRIWNVTKTAAEMDLIRYHNPTPTLCTYRLGFIYTLDRKDKYGIKILPSGWAYPNVLPAWYRRTRQGLVLRYDSMGSYHGDSRFKEVGIGDCRPLPDTYTLGAQFTCMTGEGTTPYSTDSGQLPGWSAKWQSQNNSGNYLKLNFSGSTANGIPAVTVSSGTATPWPNTMTQTNPFREYVYVLTTNGQHVYQMALNGDAASTWLEAVFVGTVGNEEATGAYTRLSKNGVGMLFADPTTMRGVISAANPWPTLGMFTTPPLYMYLTSRSKQTVGDAHDTWVDKTPTGSPPVVTPEDNAVDWQPMPSIVRIDSYGTSLYTPALGKAGVLEFTGSNYLATGNYELTIVSAQVGQADEDFDGFAVGINVNDTVIQRRLLRGKSGYNFSGTDTFQFYLDDEVSGNYLISFDWTNPLTDTAKGTKRQLAILGYTLRHINTEIFKVEALSVGSPTFTQLSTDISSIGTTPGGWFAAINSYGTAVGYQHESTIYTSNENTAAIYPVGDTLSPLTNERRDDIIYTGTNVVVADTGTITMPNFTAAGTAPQDAPAWVWAGALTSNPSFTVTVKTTGQTTLRLAVSESSTFSDSSMTDMVASGADNYTKIKVDGLKPWTTYYYAVETGGSIHYEMAGTVATSGTGAQSFKFAVVACENNTSLSTVSNAAWGFIHTQNPMFVMHVGDFHYYNINVNDPSFYRTAFNNVLSESKHKAFYRQHGVMYMWDDHDYGPNDGSSANVSRPAARSAYRQVVPHLPLAAGDGNQPIYYAFTVGRCRFIVTDCRSERTPVTVADNNNKTVLGAAQKAWFKQELLAASSSGDIAAIFWVNSFPWTGVAHPEANPSVENWAAYPTERKEIADYIYSKAIRKVFILSGDMHATAFDDGRTYDFHANGTNSVAPNGHGLPVFQCGQLYNSNSQKGTPYQIGPFYTGSGTRSIFGMVQVDDYGSYMLITFTARSGASGAIVNVGGIYVTATLNSAESPRP